MHKLKLLAALLLAVVVVAGNSSSALAGDRHTRGKWHSQPMAKAPTEKPKYKPWGEVTKDAVKKEGLFNVYTDREDLFFEVKEDQLDTPFLMLMSLSQGFGSHFVLGGLPISPSIMFDFHRTEDHIQVRQLNTLFRSDDKALNNAIDLTFGPSVLFQMPIISENTDNKSFLLDMNDAFLSDISDMAFWLQIVLQKPVRMDPKKGTYRSIKAFPRNVEVDALLTYSPGDRRGLWIPSVPDNRFIQLGVHYSINALPEEQWTPRRADDRVGYFMTPFKDFSNDSKESFFVHNINRWKLVKKDPGAAVSDPVEPITFYMDNTIPEEYLPYVKQGIEMWQKAYEAAGFSNAIIAKKAPTMEEDPDYDPEDARYNTIRWIVSDEPSFGAIGPSRVDPRTGQILDADILMEQNMIANFRKAYRRYAGPEALMQSDPMLKHLVDPEDDPNEAAIQELKRRVLGMNGMCDIGFGFAQGFDFMNIALLADGTMDAAMDVPKEYTGAAIAYVTAHEVGHTLGLRHNFKSSIATPYESLNDKTVINDIGMTGSVMDYSAPNVSRNRSAQGYYYSPSVGTYDQWAITYGYKDVPGDTPEAQYEKLVAIAAEQFEKKNAYGTDEDTYPAGALDPSCAIWDLSDNPLAWAEERLGVCQDIFNNGNLAKRVVNEDGNYVPLRYATETVLIQEYIAMPRAVKYIGGQYTARPHRGDDGGKKPLMPVSADQQRKAMAFITTNAFSPTAFALSPELLNMLQDNKLWDWQNNTFQYGRRFDFPLYGWVGAIQNAILVQLMNPMLQQRLLESSYKVDKPYRLSEVYRALTGAIWYDNMVPAGKTQVMQRNLQRIYLDKLVDQVVTPPPGTPQEAVALARMHLTNLGGQIDKAYARSGLSDEQNAHLLESKGRIERALNADMISGY